VLRQHQPDGLGDGIRQVAVVQVDTVVAVFFNDAAGLVPPEDDLKQAESKVKREFGESYEI
jgi:hypothetical protein